MAGFNKNRFPLLHLHYYRPVHYDYDHGYDHMHLYIVTTHINLLEMSSRAGAVSIFELRILGLPRVNLR